jgi:hypothetical protein
MAKLKRIAKWVAVGVGLGFAADVIGAVITKIKNKG